MKSRILTAVVLIGLAVGCSSCELLTGIGAGAATVETLHSWQDNLETKRADLERQYAEVLAELESAPDPNAIRAARQKIEAIQQQQLVNQGALLAVKAALELPGGDAQPGDKNAYLAGIIAEAIGLGYFALTKRSLGAKYKSAKVGQTRLEKEMPEAGKHLYSMVGEERARRGV